MTADDLRNAQNEFAASEDETRELRLTRNTTIQTALEAGWTHAQISQATGLTRGRIGQLAQSFKPPLSPTRARNGNS